MSPKKRKKPIVLAPVTITPSGLKNSLKADHSNLFEIDPNHAETLEKHIKENIGGSLVSVCL